MLTLTLAGELTLAYDARILSEFAEVLRRPEFGFSAEHIGAVLEALEQDGIPLTARPLPERLPDPAMSLFSRLRPRRARFS